MATRHSTQATILTGLKKRLVTNRFSFLIDLINFVCPQSRTENCKFIDGAIQHISASNCLEPDILVELREEMRAAEGGMSDFYDRIRAFRKALPSMIPKECIE